MDRQARGGTLILGGGFADSYVAKLLKKQGATIVSLENFMLFASMLPEAASGTLEPRHVVVPLRLMCPHADRRRVQVETDEGLLNITYRDLVVALGAIPRTFPIPGLAEYAFGFKDLADAIALRNHVLRRLEAAVAAPNDAHRRRELTFVFVGAGYAGVEALAELSDLARDALRYYPADVQATPQHWVLVDAAPKILPEIPPRLGEYAAEQLERRGVDIRVSTTLEAVEGHAALLSDGDRIPTSTVVWTTGAPPNPLLARFGLPLDDFGRVKIDSTFRVEGLPNVLALGDCARVPNEATPDRPDPPTSQHALRQARRLAKNLRGDPKPYRYRMLGQVATLGRRKGIAEVLGLRFRGFLGWFITRTYHLYQLRLFSRKLRVVTRLDRRTPLQTRHRRAQHARASPSARR
jgi:NADH:quinone reductase (non-electrogenic)